ncbi:hypothetical protein Tco_0182086, partial [Tanacetum coccineum]
ETVDVSEESEPEPTKRRITSRRVVKKKVTISANDNIIPDIDATLEIMTESVPELAKKNTGSRSSRSVVIQDTPSALNPKPVTSNPKLKGVPDESTVVSATSDEGTGIKPGVLDEENVITEEKVIFLEWVSEQESEYSEEDQLDDEEKDDKEGDADDEGDDHISDTQDTDGEDDETKL